MGLMALMKKKTNLLFLLIIISAASLLFSTSFAGRQWRFMDNSAMDVIATNYKEISSSQYVKQPAEKKVSDDEEEEKEEVVVVHERVLRVNTKDYGHYDPSPTLVKPPFKLIPN